MPGIFGFTHFIDDEGSRRLLDAMAGVLQEEPTYQTYTHTGAGISLGRVGLPVVQPHPQPAWNEGRTVAVMMEGEIFEYARHRAFLEDRGHCFATDSQAELFGHYYEESGPEFVRGLNGVFAAAIWDAPKRRLTLVNDHMALQPLYYTPNRPDRFLFASGVRAILASPDIPRTLDRLAIGELLTFDHVLHDHTLLAEIKQLPAASILTVADGQIHLERYWHPYFCENYPVRNEGEYLEELRPLLRQAFARQLPGEQSAAVLISGGLDSRVVAAELGALHKGAPIQTFTFGQPGCDDERFANEVSTKLRMPHQFYTLESDYLIQYANKGVRLSDGMANVVHMHTLPNLASQAGRARIMYKGFLGDALFGYGISDRLWASYAKADLPRMQLASLQDIGGVLYQPEQLDQLMLHAPGTSPSQQVMDSYAEAIQASQSDLPADQRNYLDLTQRVPRMTLNGVEWVRSQAHVRLPFADKDLVEFVCTVPPGYRVQRKLMVELFIRDYPHLAKIPYTGTGLPMVHCRRDVTIRANQQLRWWLRAAGMKWVPMPGKRPYARYNDWLRDGLRPWMEGILLGKRFAERGIFDPGMVKRLVQDQLSGASHHSRLGALIAIELWHQQFID